MAKTPQQGMTQTEWLAYLTTWAQGKQRDAAQQYGYDAKQVMRWKGIVATCKREERKWANRHQLAINF